MSSWRDALFAAALSVVAAAAAAQSSAYAGIGRAATDKEIAAWDIDVRPDFKGLPKGQGTVAQGMDVWEAKCASCHGVFGESNEVFSPIVGGTTAEDIKTGRVARLRDGGYPGRTTLMKLTSVSTLWDYIHRAMPWSQPKSLKVDEVYAVTAYILNMGGVLPDDFTLSDRNIAEVQQRLPNRAGGSTDHGLWPGKGLGHGRPDVKAAACMKDCAVDTKVASVLPDHARNSHGNLAEQNRLVGAQRGADTSRPSGSGAAPVAAVATAPAASASSATPAAPATPATPATSATSATSVATAASAPAAQPTALLSKHGCVACHGMDNKIVGPGFTDIARKHAGRGDLEAYLSGKIRAGGSGVWGAIPMPPQTLPEADATAIARWLAQQARK